MKTVIIGLGNPILSDDSVGIKVSREIRERLRNARPGASREEDMDIKEVYAGGIRLMDAMNGYDRACIIDAMVTGQSAPGDICRLSPDDLCGTRNMLCTHDTNLNTALDLGRMLRLPLPTDIRIWGIEAADVTTFSESLTDAVSTAVTVAVERILEDLNNAPEGEAQ